MISYQRKRSRDSISDTSSRPKKVKKSSSSDLQPLKCGKSKQTQLCFALDDADSRSGESELGFAAKICPKCGMAYTPGTEDEHLHELFHRRETSPAKNTLLFSHCEVVSRHESSGTAVLLVSTEDYRNKQGNTRIRHTIDAVLNTMNTALGSPAPSDETDGSLLLNEGETLLLCAHERSGTVYGAVIAKKISNARSLVVGGDDEVVRCCGPLKPATAGIEKIFVYEKHRRKGVATRLIDAVRSSLVYGYLVPLEELAFTQPTRDGRALFSKYCGTKSFLVYDSNN